MNSKQFLYYLGAQLPLLMLALIIATIYSIYMITYLIPLIQGKFIIHNEEMVHVPYLIQIVQWNDKLFDEFNRGYLFAIVIHFFLLMLLICIYRATKTEAGRVPQSWLDQINNEIHNYLQNENEIMNQTKKYKKLANSNHSSGGSTQCGTNTFGKKLDLENSQIESSINSDLDEDLRIELNLRAKIELIDKQGRRFCKNCSSFKPSRCHHCRQCKVCWLKMDHHCQWLNTCIGLKNYKLFINLITYALMLISFITFTYAKCYYDTLRSSNNTDVWLYIVSFEFIFCIMLMLLLVGFCTFHFWQILM